MYVDLFESDLNSLIFTRTVETKKGNLQLAYELKDENGRLVKEDGNFGWLHFILCMLIPLAGFIFFFIKKDAQPLSAKTGLIVGFCNIGLIALRLVFG